MLQAKQWAQVGIKRELSLAATDLISGSDVSVSVTAAAMVLCLCAEHTCEDKQELHVTVRNTDVGHTRIGQGRGNQLPGLAGVCTITRPCWLGQTQFCCHCHYRHHLAIEVRSALPSISIAMPHEFAAMHDFPTMHVQAYVPTHNHVALPANSIS